MLALIATVFGASLLGSLHCAGMCGALVAFAVGPGRTPRSAIWPQLGYHGGRMASYALLGVIAGTVGAAVDFGGAMVGLQRAAAALAGALMIVFGVGMLLQLSGLRIPDVPLPDFLRRTVMRGQTAALRFSPMGRATAVGALTPLLPCGWLYAFVVVAAGTANPVWGGLTMVAFWAGTVPVLASLGAGVQALLGRFGRRVPVIAALAIVIVGTYTVFNRMLVPLDHGLGLVPESTAAAATPPTSETGIERVQRLVSEVPPCCRDTAPQTDEAEGDGE